MNTQTAFLYACGLYASAMTYMLMLTPLAILSATEEGWKGP